MNKSLIVKTLAVFVLLFFVIAAGSKAWKDFQIKEDLKKQDAMYSQILDGATAKPLTLNVDYSKKTSDGSPLIFGGAQTPLLKDNQAWDKISDVGITSIRRDFFIESEIPNTTISDYKNNIDNIQNTSTWNQESINERNQRYIEAKKRNMTTIGIISYAPKWLTFSGTREGVPIDWSVYEDIIKKVYLLHRKYLDYVEIWNEPTYNKFLNLNNSSYSREEAYKLIYYHAAKAIRNMDLEINDGKKVLIGGPVTYKPNTLDFFDSFVSDSNIRKYLDFVSYHNYGFDEPSWQDYKKILNKYNLSSVPIFITEWNYDSDENLPNEYNYGTKALLYTSNKLLEFLKGGIYGANYYLLEPLVNQVVDKKDYMGFYRYSNNNIILVTQSHTWRLMSKQMMLGKGPSSIYDLNTNDADINAVGFKNSAGQFGAVLVNNASESKLTTIHFKNFNLANYAKVNIFNASADNDATKPVYTGEVKVKDHGADLVVYLPKEAIIGLSFSEDKNWYDFINLPY